MKKGRMMMFCLAVLAVVSTGATLAAWSQAVQTGNEYMVPRYRTSLEENFRQPDDWQPGITTQKQVWVSNNLKDEDGELESGVPAIAKVEIHQSWIRRENVYAVNASGSEIPVPPLEGEPLPLTFTPEAGTQQYAAILHFNPENVMVLQSGRAEEEGLRLGLPYADSVADARGKWLIADENPSETGNYILYYIGVIDSGEDSPVFLESVTMNPLLENTVLSKDSYYVETKEGWKLVTESAVNARYGYDGCRYTMDIKATTVQATKAAVEHTFTGGFHEDIIYYLANEIADPAVYDASDLEKKLTIVRNRGTNSLEYIPYRNEEGKEEGNWFMSFTDMVPGGIYRDSLKIENATSNQRLQVYMRILPRQQDAIKDELLEKITMKVSIGDTVIYQGKVTGKAYGTGTNLRELVPLCYLQPGASQTVQVELMLDPGITCDPVTGACIYADQLTKIDWEFLVQAQNDNTPGGGGPGDPGGGSPGNPGGGSPGGNPPTVITETDVPLTTMIPDEEVPLAILLPKTGDNSYVTILAVISAGSFLLLILLGAAQRKNRKQKK